MPAPVGTSPLSRSELALDTAAIPVDSLETLRQRLSQLTHWLTHLLTAVQQSSLPNWPSLLTQFTIVLKQLNFLSSTLTTNLASLQSLNAYPLPFFPVASEASLLATLLRKRVDPDVDDWIRQGSEHGNKILQQQQDGPHVQQHEDKNEELWKFAKNVVVEEREGRAWDGLLTADQLLNSQPNLTAITTPARSSPGDAEMEATLEQVLRYTYQGVHVHEPVRKKLPAGQQQTQQIQQQGPGRNIRK
ncbi:mediator complex, subunit Med8 [Lipomyces japonicus]|uniref:mediator complex, subunit Med8 n=1 Tax=Lipomyces japonicus TaxID=56871 RepID=UPI0034CE76C3